MNNSCRAGELVFHLFLHSCCHVVVSIIAPKGDVHSQQRFHYMSHSGDISVDQAHRGYTIATDKDGFASVNPLYMSYEPDTHGNFAGQFHTELCAKVKISQMLSLEIWCVVFVCFALVSSSGDASLL